MELGSGFNDSETASNSLKTRNVLASWSPERKGNNLGRWRVVRNIHVTHFLFACWDFCIQKVIKLVKLSQSSSQLTLIFCGMEVRLSASYAVILARQELAYEKSWNRSLLLVVIIRGKNKKTLPQASFYNVRDFIILIIPVKQGWFGSVKGIPNRDENMYVSVTK